MLLKAQFLKLHHTHAIRAMVETAQLADKLWKGAGHAERINQVKNYFDWCKLHTDPKVLELARHHHLVNPEMTQEHFLGILIPLERSHTRGVMDHDFQVAEGDQPKGAGKSSQTSLILDNIRSSFNVGSAFRSAECFGVDHIYLTGYTAGPNNQKTKKTSMGTSDVVPWGHHKRCFSLIQEIKKARASTVYAVETVPSSASLYETDIKFPAVFVFGNERHGLSPDVLSICHDVIHIPLRGIKNSLNVGVSLGVCLGEAQRQLLGKSGV